MRFLQVVKGCSCLLQEGPDCDGLYLMDQCCVPAWKVWALLMFFFDVFVTVGLKMRTEFNRKHFLTF